MESIENSLAPSNINIKSERLELEIGVGGVEIEDFGMELSGKKKSSILELNEEDKEEEEEWKFLFVIILFELLLLVNCEDKIFSIWLLLLLLNFCIHSPNIFHIGKSNPLKLNWNNK